MRANARAQQVILRVLKNTLVKKAISNGKFAALNPYMKGPLIYSISTDPVAAAKVIHQSASVKIIAGMYNGTILDATAVANLAVIRPREQLLSMLLSVMKQAPTAFIRAVAALRDKREQESSANIA
jgi:large subunit ribosomal protein L10